MDKNPREEPRAKSSLMMHRFSKDNLTIRKKSTHSIDQAKSAILQQHKGGDHLLTVVTSKSFSTKRGDSLHDYQQQHVYPKNEKPAMQPNNQQHYTT